MCQIFVQFFASMIWAKANVTIFKGYLQHNVLFIYGAFFLWSDIDVRCVKWPNELLYENDQCKM